MPLDDPSSSKAISDRLTFRRCRTDVYAAAVSTELLTEARATAAARRSAAISTSARRLNLPKPTRSVLAASDLLSPKANSTWEGCNTPALHAAFVRQRDIGLQGGDEAVGVAPRKCQA